MTSKQSLGGSCSPTPPSPPPPPLPPPNPPPPLASIQQEMPSSSSSIEQRHHHHDVVMEGSVTPPTLPSTSTHQISPGASTTTSTPSSTSSAKGAGSSGSATTATTGTTGTTGTTTTTATRNKRQELSFAERIQVIQARTSGKSMRQLAVQFGCGKTQILNILGQRDAYLKEWDEKQAESNPHISARKRRSRRTGNEETNQKVWDWYNRQKNMGIRVTGPMLQREARSIARNLNIPNFAASNGWLDSFRRLHNIGPQNKGMADRRSGNPSTSAAGTGVGQSSTTPEPRPGYGSMMAASSSTEFPGSSHSAQLPTSSRDPLPTASQRPPPPLEAFGYPLHSSGYYHPQTCLEEEDEEDDDEEEEEEARRSNEDIEFDPSRPSLQTIHSHHRDQGAIHHPETEFGRSFAMMTNFHDSSNSTGGPSTHHQSVSPSPYHPAQSSSSVDASDFHRHRGGYSEPYDRQHSSSSSNSLAFSPTEVYSPSRHPGHHHQSSIVGHRSNNNGSRSTEVSPIDCRRPPSDNLISPSFQQVSSSLFEHDFTPAPTFQSQEPSRSIIQDGRARGNGGSAMSGVALQQQQQQRRTSVLTSTHAVTAAAAAAAAASLENQQLLQQQQQQQLINEDPGDDRMMELEAAMGNGGSPMPSQWLNLLSSTLNLDLNRSFS
ncbi:hypothetical protein DAPPUDRAFT_94311 [Daphnia pulex]|uniref:HTH CENPB-type domain-containing protein n=1 Tax=Daphnia pulex TaxID=6669 RepID=E9FR12_DAPPU|nr:hypothetical protein DAPPUDRAFT_94311 [Daphnia pulex]|eukprot:EFX90269.1 hypothetical protein DAPPUDRAFT_94311 [Daphnia pulex]